MDFDAKKLPSISIWKTVVRVCVCVGVCVFIEYLTFISYIIQRNNNNSYNKPTEEEQENVWARYEQ